ncbi:MAG: transposase [Pyrinomonadaceae bacterium]|nr:transposase [Pyrinomonadaceae bacterium]
MSKDSPVLYLTSVTNSRLPVFRTSRPKELLCEALDEARTSASFLVFAYVIMTDHLHALIGSKRKPSEVARYINGISSRRVINYLREAGYESSLQKLRHATGVRAHKYSLWDHHPNLKLVTTENGLMEKANYIHQNPVRSVWWPKLWTTAGPAFDTGDAVRSKTSP